MVINFVAPIFNIPPYHNSGSSFVEEDPNSKAIKFYSLLNDIDASLYQSCTKNTKLLDLS